MTIILKNEKEAIKMLQNSINSILDNERNESLNYMTSALKLLHKTDEEKKIFSLINLLVFVILKTDKKAISLCCDQIKKECNLKK